MTSIYFYYAQAMLAFLKIPLKKIQSIFLSWDTLRYIITGALVTIFGTLILTLLLFVIPYGVAYTIVFLFSVVLNIFLQSKFVFKRSIKGKLPLIILGLIIQYIIGYIGLYILLDVMQLSKALAPTINLFICTPINFLIVRAIYYADIKLFEVKKKC